MDRTIDSKAFEILVQQHHRRIMAYALALARAEDVAEDLVQDAFLAAYCGLKTFDSRKDFGNWVRGIVRNKFLERTRNRREFALTDETLAQLEARHAGWDQAEIEGRGESLAALRQCLAGLGEVNRRLIGLYYEQNESSASIARIMGMTDSAVRKHLERIRKALLRCIEHRLGAT